MSYHAGDRPSGLRYREEGIELRCETCPKAMRWWPLTPEFWSFKQSFRRCKACLVTDKNRRDRERCRRPEVQAKNREYQAVYRKDAGKVRAIKNQQRYWSDPEYQRAKARAYYYAHREDVLAKRRARYYAERAA